MAKIHQLVLDEGLFAAERQATSKTARRVARLAAQSLADEPSDPAYSHPGLCLTVLPHRPTPPGKIWKRSNNGASLSVHPIQADDGSYRGVPYGAKARLILLWLQTEALRTGSRTVELGRSMRQWILGMGASDCGSNYRAVLEQAERIEHSLLVFSYTDADGDRTRWQDSIIRGSFDPRGGDRIVEVSEGYYAALTRHPVPLSEPAIRRLSDSCGGLDAYLWLAYRLHALNRPILVSWEALFVQFGAGTKELKHFKPRFRKDLELATACYPEARIEMTDHGLRLWPSRPPIAKADRLASA
jgi:hypothetical protein